MKKDFIWVRKVILNRDNKTIHYEALLELINLFSAKWKHVEKDPRYNEAYKNKRYGRKCRKEVSKTY